MRLGGEAGARSARVGYVQPFAAGRAIGGFVGYCLTHRSVAVGVEGGLLVGMEVNR